MSMELNVVEKLMYQRDVDLFAFIFLLLLNVSQSFDLSSNTFFFSRLKLSPLVSGFQDLVVS